MNFFGLSLLTHFAASKGGAGILTVVVGAIVSITWFPSHWVFKRLRKKHFSGYGSIFDYRLFTTVYTTNFFRDEIW